MKAEDRGENQKEPWETPTVDVCGNLLDITAASTGTGPNDGLFSDGASG